MREAAQVVSYEVPLGICVIIPIMLAGTMNLTTIANAQAGLFTNWYIFHDPFTFMVFWVYFTCAVASVNRAPFDLAEAESELVAGFHTEYSGLRWSFFFMAEYGSMFLVSGLATILFFGGWHGPIPIWTAIGVGEAGTVTEMTSSQMFANMFGCINFIGKAVLGVIVMMWVRWTFPRLRIDQVLTTCLKYCVPLASIAFVGVLVWEAYNIPFLNDLAPAQLPGQNREAWVVEANPEPTEEEEAESDGQPAEEEQPSETEDDQVASVHDAASVVVFDSAPRVTLMSGDSGATSGNRKRLTNAGHDFHQRADAANDDAGSVVYDHYDAGSVVYGDVVYERKEADDA